MTTPVKFKNKNNGWGNGDQDAPGNSGPNNNAENSDREPPPGIVKKFASTSDQTEDATYLSMQEELSQIETEALTSQANSNGNSAAARRIK